MQSSSKATLSADLRSYDLFSPEEQLAFTSPEPALKVDQIYQYILGLDAIPPKPMSEKDLEELNDPFANLLLKKGNFPLTLTKLLEAFDRTGHLKAKHIFHIAEGGQIPWSQSEKLNRTFRLAISLDITMNNAHSKSNVLVSTGKGVDSEVAFLQVMSWDDKDHGFNFYQRLRGKWIWAGHSKHALMNKTRGKGPFSGHVNGAPVMKELRQPWSHWNSSDATIHPDIFPPQDPFLQTPLFKERKNADEFEPIIRTKIVSWNQVRVNQYLQGEVIENPIYFMRQLLDNSTINLVSSDRVSTSHSGEAVRLPFTFFIHVDALTAVQIFPEEAFQPIRVTEDLYFSSLREFKFALVAKEFSQDGDTHFAFLVPEPTFEDSDLIDKLVQNGVLDRRLSACLLMVDFPNPVYSNHRKELLKYVPDKIERNNGGNNLAKKMVQAIEESGKHTMNGTAEYEFFSFWKASANSGWEELFKQRIASYFSHLQEKIKTQEGFYDFVRLAEYRRFLVKKQPIFEFSLTFAVTNISISPLQMTEEGTVIDAAYEFPLEINNDNSGMSRANIF